MTLNPDLSEQQQITADFIVSPSLFLEGNPGTGKSTAALQRLANLLELDIPGQQVLVLVPSRNAIQAYQDTISSRGNRASIMTFSTLVKRSLELFWPTIAESAGFRNHQKAPIFLTNETSQIFMAEIIREKMRAGYFNSLQLSPSRTYNQILIAYHKLAAAGLPPDSYAQRMKSAWTGESAFLDVFDHVQDCILVFRNLCMEYNLLDYAIQLELFKDFLFPGNSFQSWITSQYRHLIFDNIEEEIPIAHDFCELILPRLESALFVYDHEGGFRDFMGGDPTSAHRFYWMCEQTLNLENSYINSPQVAALAATLKQTGKPATDLKQEVRRAFEFTPFRDYSSMIKQVAIEVADLIRRQQVPPEEIVIITPLNADILYISIERELRIQNISCYIHRPSRPLFEEKETRSFITLTEVLHPEWDLLPALFDISLMLQTFIPGLDPLRAQRLAAIGFKVVEDPETMEKRYAPQSTMDAKAATRDRFPEQVLGSFEILRKWIMRNQSTAETPDMTLTRFFHEILSQEGFSSYTGGSEMVNLAAGKVIESMKNFRKVLEQLTEITISWKDYFSLVHDGMVSAFYYEDWFAQPADAVLVTLAGTYAMMNKPVRHQIWLNAGASRWWERVYGQLTNDLILSRSWQPGSLWDADTIFANNDAHMNRLVQSLIARCKQQVRVYASELNESGQDQKSRFLYFLSSFANQLAQLHHDASVPSISNAGAENGVGSEANEGAD